MLNGERFNLVEQEMMFEKKEYQVIVQEYNKNLREIERKKKYQIMFSIFGFY